MYRSLRYSFIQESSEIDIFDREHVSDLKKDFVLVVVVVVISDAELLSKFPQN